MLVPESVDGPGNEELCLAKGLFELRNPPNPLQDMIGIIPSEWLPANGNMIMTLAEFTFLGKSKYKWIIRVSLLS